MLELAEVNNAPEEATIGKRKISAKINSKSIPHLQMIQASAQTMKKADSTNREKEPRKGK
jgi:hypothetical protein